MIWFAWIAFEIAIHYVLIVGLKRKPIYKYVYLWRFMWGVLFFFWRHPEFDPAGDPTTIFPAVVYACFQWSSFYLLFDPILNILRGYAPLYQGKNSGALDKLPTSKYCLLKMGTLLIFMLSSIAIYYGKG